MNYRSLINRDRRGPIGRGVIVDTCIQAVCAAAAGGPEVVLQGPRGPSDIVGPQLSPDTIEVVSRTGKCGPDTG